MDQAPPTTSQLEHGTNHHLTIAAETLKQYDEVFVIGDIHGCAVEFEELVQRVHDQSPSKNPDKTLKILVGDLVNKGSHSREVIDMILDRWHNSTLAVIGNHELVVLREYLKLQAREDIKENDRWIKSMTARQIDYLKSLPYTITIPSLNSIVVHAGFSPVKDFMIRTSLQEMVTLRNLIEKRNESTGEVIDYQPTKDPTIGIGPWSKFWKGPYHVYYGHDARRKLQEFEYATGLDTGCVYGNRLTGIYLKGPRTKQYEFVQAKKIFSDLNFFPMTVESNIYGMTSLDFDEGNSKVLVATRDCQIFCVDYNKYRPQAKEIEFTYIPSGAKIVSIDAFRRLDRPNDFVIGITHSLTSINQLSNTIDVGSDNEKNQTFYLNIYASGSQSNDFDLDYIAQGCQTIPINYVPYHLYHTDLAIPRPEGPTINLDVDTIWLLSGGDRCIHSFQEDKSNQCFVERPLLENFPEFDNLPSIALWIDSKSFHAGEGYQRLTAVGFETGSVTLSLTRYDMEHSCYKLIQTWSYDRYSTIVPSVRIFTTKSRSQRARYSPKMNVNTKDLLESGNSFNLLLVSSIDPSLIFENIVSAGFSQVKELPESQRVDCCTTSCINDIDFDGYNELMIGTYGQELLIYKFDPIEEEFFMARKHQLNYPIYAISSLDITGDVMMDLVILVTNGIHVLQANVDEVIDICKHRVKSLLQDKQ